MKFKCFSFINAFADQTQPLPVGWQIARQCGQPLYVDHANRQISPFDPRLPAPPQPKGCRSAPPIRRNKKPTTTVHERSNNCQNRQRNGIASNGIWSWELAEKADQIQAILAEHSPELAQRVNFLYFYFFCKMYLFNRKKFI